MSPLFDVTGKALLFYSEGERICSEKQLLLPGACAAEKVASLLEAGTDVLICGAISRDALSTATNAGIRVYPFIAGDVGRFFWPVCQTELKKVVLQCRGVPSEWPVPACANMFAEKSGERALLSSANRNQIKRRFNMPRGDGTGPRAMGARTGRGAGNCAGGQNRGTVNSGSNRGGLGRIMCNWFNASDLAGRSAQDTEYKLLMEQADALRKELDALDSRLNEFKK